ncbi:unnamed protein product [Rotaria magnacalcarata]|uniref:Uncharacterized protein n=2 Tax=Rotaria magnacalcarata TaxID=392030 RepID=A0A819HP16_9BILA|nr:unnamed protein product [Rotaria magnacalcarata]
MIVLLEVGRLNARETYKVVTETTVAPLITDAGIVDIDVEFVVTDVGRIIKYEIVVKGNVKANVVVLEPTAFVGQTN